MIWGLCLLYCTYRENLLIQVCIQWWLTEISGWTICERKAKKTKKNKKVLGITKEKCDCDQLRPDRKTQKLWFQIKHFLDVVSCGSVRLHTDGSVSFPLWSHGLRTVWRERWNENNAHRAVDRQASYGTHIIQATFLKQVLILEPELPECLFWDVTQI